MHITDISDHLLRSFNDEGHWYTSYPSLNHWHQKFGDTEYRNALAAFKGPLHLYIHIPFCAKLCYYCICNIVITNDKAKIQFFLDHLLKEIDHLRKFHPDIKDVHFGGGTPSHLERAQFCQLCKKLNTICDLKSLEEVAMEIDPRTVTPYDLQYYASKGVNRISFGIQDFDPKVQEAINRVQPPEMIEALLTPEVRGLFKGINFDILYGLPLQTWETLKRTIEQVVNLKPSRLTILKYCHAPELRRHMKLIRDDELPQRDELPRMFVNIVQSLLDAGYKWIGLDHFALPSDPLYYKHSRTFNGFSSGTSEMIGIGPTTTSVFGGVYAQAHYDLNEYYNAVNRGEFPILRGYQMTKDDLMRRKVIFRLLCLQQVDFTYTHWYFEREVNFLKQMPELVRFDNWDMHITDHGRILLRNICKVFDVKDTRVEHHKIAQLSITRKAPLAV